MKIGHLTATRRGALATLVVLGVAALCIRLGFWQLDRLEQRDRLNAAIQTRMQGEPVSLERTPADTSGWAYRRVRLEGRCDASRPIVLAGRSRRGMPGAHLLCAFLPAAGGDAILLDRGWAPAPDARSVERRLLTPPTGPRSVMVQLTPLPPASGDPIERDGAMDAGLTAGEGGLVLQPDLEPLVLYRLNRRDAAALLPYPVSPLYARVLPPDSLPAGAPLSTGSAEPPIAPAPPDLSRGPHLGYALQWFSFAAIALIGWAALAWQRGELSWSDAGEPD